MAGDRSRPSIPPSWSRPSDPSLPSRRPAWIDPGARISRPQDPAATAWLRGSSGGSAPDVEPANPTEEHEAPRVPVAAHEALQQRFDGLATERANLREALAAEQRRNAALESSLEVAQQRLEDLHADIVAGLEEELLQLALAVARRVVGRELQIDPSLVAAWAHEAVAALGAHGGALVTLSPDLADPVPPAAWTHARESGDTVVTDASLPPGTLTVSAGPSTVETGPAARLAAVSIDVETGTR